MLSPFVFLLRWIRARGPHAWLPQQIFVSRSCFVMLGLVPLADQLCSHGFCFSARGCAPVDFFCVGRAHLGGVSLCRFRSPRCSGPGFVFFVGQDLCSGFCSSCCRQSRLLDSGHAVSFGQAESRADFTLKLLRSLFVAGVCRSVLALPARSGFSAADFLVLWSAGPVLARQIRFSAPRGSQFPLTVSCRGKGALSVFSSEISRVKCSFCPLALVCCASTAQVCLCSSFLSVRVQE
jgi:hypothetical protein